MKKLVSILTIVNLISIGTVIAQQRNWSDLEAIFGKKGSVQDNVFKITFPRSDLKVSVGEYQIEPGLALSTWIGFIEVTDHAKMNDKMTMMMGDLVLLDEEVEPVIKKIVDLQLEITAIHNHILGESPAIKYMHFSGKGDAVKLAEAIKSVIQITATPFAATAVQGQPVQPDWSKVEEVLGTSGKHNGNLLQYGFPRLEKLTESGMQMPPSIGMATAVNFQAHGNTAAITGDFVLLADEVNPVIKVLTENGIVVTALHNHMLYDNPRLFMMHFWAVDDPKKLALGIKAALDKTNSKFP